MTHGGKRADGECGGDLDAAPAIDRLLYARNSLDKAREIFAKTAKHRPRIQLTIRQRTRVLPQWPGLKAVQGKPTFYNLLKCLWEKARCYSRHLHFSFPHCDMSLSVGRQDDRSLHPVYGVSETER